MEISKKAKFLVENMNKKKVTYSEVIEKFPELQEQIDAYIEEKKYVIDKTV